MTRQLLAACLLFFLVSRVKETSSWSVAISPEGAHIRENKAVTIMCRTTQPLGDCTFKIDARPSLTFTAGALSSMSVVLHEGKPVYTAKYTGRGLHKGQCGLRLSGVAAGVYVVGCQLKTQEGSVRQEFTTLTVDNSQPLKLKVNRKYQLVEPGSDVSVLCNTEKRQKINHCAFRLSSNKWVLFQKGHESRETSNYHYHGRGLEKGHCGVNLLNVTEADSGVVLCHVKVGARHAVRAVAVRVSKLQPELAISWDVKPAVAPGETLRAECVMEGAYPLPKMMWTYDGSTLRSSDVHEDVNVTFSWPWENQVMRQELSTIVGDELGTKNLKCSAEDREVGDDEVPSQYKAWNPTNEIQVSVEPKCGLLTTAHFNGSDRHGVGKRSVATSASASASSSASVGGAVLTVDSQQPVQQLDRNQQAVNSSPPPASGLASRLASGDDDYEEPNWDEEAEGSVEPLPDVIERPEGGVAAMVGGQEVYHSQKVSWLHGAKSVLHPDTPDDAVPWSHGGTPVIDSIHGGTSVFDEPAEKTPLLYQSVGGIPLVLHPSIGGTPVVLNIVGGKEVPKTAGSGTEESFVAYPWTAGVYKVKNGSYTQQCGGTLVTAKHVISAAHCFWNEQTSRAFAAADYKMALGKIYRKWSVGDEQVQRRGVAALHVHPAFRGRKRNFQHDIAVAELDADVEFTARVAPACLDWKTGGGEGQLVNGEVGVVTGWGYTEDGTPSDVLRFVHLPYVDPDTCFDMLPEDMQQLMTTDKFCAGFTGHNTSVCPGDSGGGLLFEHQFFGAYFLRGVVSVSFRPPSFTGKCYYSQVTGFTLVSQSMPWLKRLLRLL